MKKFKKVLTLIFILSTLLLSACGAEKPQAQVRIDASWVDNVQVCVGNHQSITITDLNTGKVETAAKVIIDANTTFHIKFNKVEFIYPMLAVSAEISPSGSEDMELSIVGAYDPGLISLIREVEAPECLTVGRQIESEVDVVFINPTKERATICAQYTGIQVSVDNRAPVLTNEVFVIAGNQNSFIVKDDKDKTYRTQQLSIFPIGVGYVAVGTDQYSNQVYDSFYRHSPGTCYTVGPNIK